MKLNRPNILNYILAVIGVLFCVIAKGQEMADSITRPLPKLEEFIYPYKDLNFVSPRFERVNFNDGSYYNSYNLRIVLTPLSEKLHIRFDLPFTSTNLSGKTATGLDDISIRGTYVLGRYRRWYHGAALKLVMPTSTDPSIGAGAWQLVPMYGIMNIFSGYKGSFTFSTEYRFSVGANKHNYGSIGILGISPNIDYWADKFYIGYYPTYLYDIKSSVWSFPFDVEAGYLIFKNWWLSAEYIIPMEKKKPFKNFYSFKLRYNISMRRSKL